MCDFSPPPGLILDILRYLPVTIALAVVCTGYEAWVFGRVLYDQPQSPPRVSRRTAVLLTGASWLSVLTAVVVALAVVAPSDSARRIWYGQQSLLLDVSCLTTLDRANEDAGNLLLHVAGAPAFSLWVLGVS